LKIGSRVYKRLLQECVTLSPVANGEGAPLGQAGVDGKAQFCRKFVEDRNDVSAEHIHGVSKVQACCIKVKRMQEREIVMLTGFKAPKSTGKVDPFAHVELLARLCSGGIAQNCKKKKYAKGA
jgi:hypothetical protein